MSEGQLMHPLIESRRDAIADLCRRHHVRRLDVFGSILTGEFDAQTSDLDFVVEFEPLDAADYADAYFDLLFALRSLFDRDIDLVVDRAIRNPYFRRNVDQTRAPLYAA